MIRRRTVLCLLAISATIVAAAAARADEPPSGIGARMPTMGGKQFWADELFFHHWRIQRNVLTGHCRLLDEKDFRHHSGTFLQCRDELAQISRQRNIPPMQGKVVIVLHGLFRTRASMNSLCKHLEQHGPYTVLNVGYPSTRRGIAEHAHVLRRIIENLHDVEEINFVAHSMGNIVIRHYLGDRMLPPKRAAAVGSPSETPVGSPSETPPTRRLDPRLKRFVMLGPPNQGSLTARVFADNQSVEMVAGASVRQLGLDWDKLKDRLATPPFEFGIIAGGKGDAKGYNPALPGDDDGVVSVAHTRLAGAGDFVVVPSLHSFIITNEKVKEYTLRFLQQGCFVSPDKRHPVGEEE